MAVRIKSEPIDVDDPEMAINFLTSNQRHNSHMTTNDVDAMRLSSSSSLADMTSQQPCNFLEQNQHEQIQAMIQQRLLQHRFRNFNIDMNLMNNTLNNSLSNNLSNTFSSAAKPDHFVQDVSECDEDVPLFFAPPSPSPSVNAVTFRGHGRGRGRGHGRKEVTEYETYSILHHESELNSKQLPKKYR